MLASPETVSDILVDTNHHIDYSELPQGTHIIPKSHLPDCATLKDCASCQKLGRDTGGKVQVIMNIGHERPAFAVCRGETNSGTLLDLNYLNVVSVKVSHTREKPPFDMLGVFCPKENGIHAHA